LLIFIAFCLCLFVVLWQANGYSHEERSPAMRFHVVFYITQIICGNVPYVASFEHCQNFIRENPALKPRFPYTSLNLLLITD
jgi:hypothetical protein